MDFKGERAVIIGGSSGLGLATAKAVVQKGGAVVIAGRSKEKLKAAAEQIKGDVTTKCLDVREEDSVKDFFSEIGRFDFLVTPGSSTSHGSCLETDSAVARDSFESKFWGQYNAVKYGAPQMNKKGAIVLFSGVLSQRPRTNTAIMTSVNSAVEGLCRALSIELAPIRVNVIAPGYIDTPRFSWMQENDRKTLFNTIAEQLPLKRIGEPEEVAESVLYLLKNTYTTGSTIHVDGGYILR